MPQMQSCTSAAKCSGRLVTDMSQVHNKLCEILHKITSYTYAECTKGTKVCTPKQIAVTLLNLRTVHMLFISSQKLIILHKTSPLLFIYYNLVISVFSNNARCPNRK